MPHTLTAHPNTPLGSSQHTGGGNSCQGMKHKLELTTQTLSMWAQGAEQVQDNFDQELRSSDKPVVTMQVQSPLRKASPRSGTS